MGRTQHFDDAEQLAETIAALYSPKITLALPLGLGKANTVANALYNVAAKHARPTLNIYTALT